MEAFLNRLREYAQVAEHLSLTDMTTMRVGGIARYVAYPKNDFALRCILHLANEYAITTKVIGKGSNILASDDDFDGLVIRLDRTLTEVYFEDEHVLAQAGASLIALSYHAMEKGLSGLEFACGIPGTIAGAVYMNAGAYKSWIGDLVEEIEVLIDDTIVWLRSEDCGWGYRESVFQHHPEWIILAVRLKLTHKPKEEIRSVIEERKTRRIESQPLDFPNAGSVFRNTDDHFAWEYIEACQLRGRQIGGAQISNKHANFIINVGHAKASDVYALIQLIQQEVKVKFGVELKTEIEFFNWREDNHDV